MCNRPINIEELPEDVYRNLFFGIVDAFYTHSERRNTQNKDQEVQT